jgi:CheY-like chemotaxis protein
LARKILLADDSVTAQNMGRRILSDAGYDVTTVNNGSAALKKIAESKPDLIVLDVYMPGYGGLEVCQRLREAPETARIPVLLTVGKLEPFKADEARRVRADGFIVKPFEASELLTALTKLEDKIVPQSHPAKPSRFAKAMAEADEFANTNEFGDSQTGWKNRLAIPPPHSHSRHPETTPEASPAALPTDREASRTEEHRPAEMKSGLEEALLSSSSMPQDITAEEIAAIKAAAAAFNAPGYESGSRLQARDQAEASVPEQGAHASAVKAHPVNAEEPAAEFATSTEDSFRNESGAAVFAPGLREWAETAPEHIYTAEPAEALATSAETRECEITSSSEETRNLGDEEVTAALASLSPANGHGVAIAIDGEGDAAGGRVPRIMAFAGATQEFSGPRWIAEPVAVMEDEATLVLEREMEQAYSAFAAADAARMSFASSPEEPYASSSAEAPPNPETASSAVGSLSNPASSESNLQESTSPAVATGGEESGATESERSAGNASPTADAIREGAAPETLEIKENAYAAAAAASPSGTETITTEAILQPNLQVEFSESVSPDPELSGRPTESQLAAAWANGRQTRESSAGSQLSSQIGDTVVEIKESSGETELEPQPDSSSTTGEEAREIANIVDSVLADLKPKLMAEIARKMKDKKK